MKGNHLIKTELFERGVRALAAAVVLQAIRDAKAGDEDAQRWLLIEGPFFLDALDIDVSPDRLFFPHPRFSRNGLQLKSVGICSV